MAELNFSICENGYDTAQVDDYVRILQKEYENAVAWGEEMEQNYNELKESTEKYGLYFTLDETNQTETISKVFAELQKTVDKIRADAENTAAQIIDEASAQAAGIRRQAMENSVEIRTQNTTIMKNLKAISDMIAVVLEKGIQ